MGRGKPFSQSLSQLVAAGVVKRPVWMAAVESTRPSFEPVVNTRPPRIHYPEDRLRNTYLLRNPDARRLPVNMKARTLAERHIADQFVVVQMRYMEEKGLSEEEAYNAADHDFHVPQQADHQAEDLYGPLTNSGIDDNISKLYLASFKDSQRDQRLFHALMKQRMSSTTK